MAPISFNTDTPVLEYVLQLESGTITQLEISETAGGVRIKTEESVISEEKKELKQKVTWMLGLDRDFSSFYRLAHDKPKLAQTEAKAQGRGLRSATFFEDVIKTILTTNTFCAAIKRMNQNLIEQFGTPVKKSSSQKAFL